MATTFTDEQAYNLCNVPLVERSHLHKWASIDPNALTTRPDLLEQCLYWQDRRDRYIKSPQVQNSYVEVHRAGLNVPSVQGISIRDAARRGLYAEQQPAPVQQAQVRKGPQYSVQQTPDPQLKAAVRNLQRTLDELPARFAAVAQKSQVRATRPPAQVQRSQAAAQAPQLPISPITGQPSSITALTRRSVGLDGGEVLNQHPYHVEQQRQAQAVATKAQYEQSLPISPITGKPSSITAMARKSVGL